MQGEQIMQRITACLWFGGNAKEAAEFYTSIFPNSGIRTTTYHDKAASEAAGMPEGSVLSVAFELDGEELIAINGRPIFQFSEAISLTVNCETQAEVDHYWSRLCDGGEEIACGWLKDRFGVTWQVVPKRLPELLADPDPKVSSGAMAAMIKMKKIDIAELERAAGL
jgi:predicted 3-demethylubiquinone-9 3-methyltransferase (glyoxalase superfamily)